VAAFGRPLPSSSPLLQALIDAPGLVRQQINYKRLSLTDIVVEIPKCPKRATSSRLCRLQVTVQSTPSVCRALGHPASASL